MHTGHDQKRYLRTSRQQFGDVVMSQLRNVLSWGGVVNGRTSSTTIANQAAVCERSTSLAYLALARLLTRIVVALTQVPLRFHCSKTQLFHFSNSTKSSYSSEHRGIKNAKKLHRSRGFKESGTADCFKQRGCSDGQQHNVFFEHWTLKHVNIFFFSRQPK